MLAVIYTIIKVITCLQGLEQLSIYTIQTPYHGLCGLTSPVPCLPLNSSHACLPYLILTSNSDCLQVARHAKLSPISKSLCLSIYPPGSFFT